MYLVYKYTDIKDIILTIVIVNVAILRAYPHTEEKIVLVKFISITTYSLRFALCVFAKVVILCTFGLERAKIPKKLHRPDCMYITIHKHLHGYFIHYNVF